MLGGLLGLAFNPSAWVAVAAALFIGLSGGFVRGYSYANSQALVAQIHDLRSAMAEKEKTIEAHDRLVDAHAAEADRLKADIEGIIHANSQEKSNLCLFTSAQLASLRQLAERAY